ncbi:acetylglutamate kinase [Loigolactobacillus jiayinensis]|uniref:Acetylglutamate kinase n=1 Tax=Loigolactobacillus jiayinensis TaxID=2486016 RepID=A0ABW1RJK5_9LACO|nr:acetylglutamate kinase [Loigolactobacillus jiayinensis]
MKQQIIVIKIGGNAVTQLPDSFFQQLARWCQQGQKILIVHGGGPKISQLSTELHLAVKKIAGVRVTDAATLELTKAVLLGLVQPELLSKLSAHHLPVIGLNAGCNQLLQGHYLDQAKYGEVGVLDQLNTAWLTQILSREIGVLAPLAQTTDGKWLNVNADTAAAEIATKLNASKLVLLTDVPGVLSAGEVVPELSQQKAHTMIAADIIKSGMTPKIKAAFAALNHGVQQAFITDDLTHTGTTFITQKAGIAQ